MSKNEDLKKQSKEYIGIITYSDGFQWVVIHYEIAKYLMLISNLEVYELYIKEEAEGLVENLKELDERNEHDAIFAVSLKELQEYNSESFYVRVTDRDFCKGIINGDFMENDIIDRSKHCYSLSSLLKAMQEQKSKLLPIEKCAMIDKLKHFRIDNAISFIESKIKDNDKRGI